jgi:hypothetical protein
MTVHCVSQCCLLVVTRTGSFRTLRLPAGPVNGFSITTACDPPVCSLGSSSELLATFNRPKFFLFRAGFFWHWGVPRRHVEAR